MYVKSQRGFSNGGAGYTFYLHSISGRQVKLAMRSPDPESVFQSSEFVIFQSFCWKNPNLTFLKFIPVAGITFLIVNITIVEHLVTLLLNWPKSRETIEGFAERMRYATIYESRAHSAYKLPKKCFLPARSMPATVFCRGCVFAPLSHKILNMTQPKLSPRDIWRTLILACPRTLSPLAV